MHLARRASALRGLRGLLLAVAAALLLGACHTDLTVDIAVDNDGSGVVTAGVALDDEAAGVFADLRSDLRVEDLRAAGWEVSGPEVEEDGLTWIRLSKPFPSADQLDDVLAELHPRLFPGATVTLTQDLERTSYSVLVQLDESMKVEDFSDPEAAGLLGAPLGFDSAELAALAGGSLDDAVSIELRMSLPDGSVVEYPGEGQPEVTLGGSGVTEFRVDTAVVDPAVADELDTADRYRRFVPWIWGGAVVVWLLLAVVLVVVLSRRRRHRRHVLTP